MPGDMVIAEVGGQRTMKCLRNRGEDVVLVLYRAGDQSVRFLISSVLLKTVNDAKVVHPAWCIII